MKNLNSLHSLLEIFLLILTLSTQYPLLGIVATIAAILCLWEDDDQDDDNDEGGNN